MDSPAEPRRGRKQAPQRAVPQSVRRSGKPLFFGWGAHLTHHEREQVKERIAGAIGVVLALAVIGILFNGWYQDNVAKPAAAAAARNKPVAYIGHTVITNGWYQKVLKYQQSQLSGQIKQYNSQLSANAGSKSKAVQAQDSAIQQILTQLQSEQTSLPQISLQQIIDDVVIQQKGPSAGLHLNAAAEAGYLHNIIYNQIGGPLHFALYAQNQGMTAAELRSILLMQYRSQHMQAMLAKNVPTTGLETHVRHILISTPTALVRAKMSTKKYAQAVKTDSMLAHRIERELQARGSWKALALRYSGDPGSKIKGGDLGWAAPSTFVPPFASAASTQKIGTIHVVRSQFGFHVLEVLGRKQVKLSASQLAQNKQQAFQNWIAKEKKPLGYVRTV